MTGTEHKKTFAHPDDVCQWAEKQFVAAKLFERDLDLGHGHSLWVRVQVEGSNYRRKMGPHGFVLPEEYTPRTDYYALVSEFRDIVHTTMRSSQGEHLGWHRYTRWAIEGLTVDELACFLNACFARFDEHMKQWGESSLEYWISENARRDGSLLNPSAESAFDPEDAVGE